MGLMHSVNFKEHPVDPMKVEAVRKAFVPVPFDPRFPNQNQSRNCYQNYLDYHRCHKIKGEDHKPCEYFKKVYQTLCHAEWFEQWDEEREEGIFAGRI